MCPLNHILLCRSLPTATTMLIGGGREAENTYWLALFDTREERESCQGLEPVPSQTRGRPWPLRCLRHLALQSMIKFVLQLALG